MLAADKLPPAVHRVKYRQFHSDRKTSWNEDRHWYEVQRQSNRLSKIPTELLSRKESGAYYTPQPIAKALLAWVLRHESDRLLDPSCGDGQFIACHKNSVGIEQDAHAARTAMERAPWALIHEGDFFSWAASTVERFDCAAGNPPFIRYQTFKGETRERAIKLCAKVGANFNGLASSWAPFLVATSTLLKAGGRMAFVVPAEIGHAPYSAPLIEYLVANFAVVHITAVRDKLFPDLSEDCWLLYVEGYGRSTEHIRFSAQDIFQAHSEPPQQFLNVSIIEWRTSWGRRLRPFIISSGARNLYSEIRSHKETQRFGDIATVGIGYVTGANDFFHFRPSDAKRLKIPEHFLQPTVRNGRVLPTQRLTRTTVARWIEEDQQMLLLKMPKSGKVPASIARYLDSEAGHIAREAYKCRSRDPWFSVPDVQIPKFFMSYMSGLEANLVRNDAGCACTNSVHSVRIKGDFGTQDLLERWQTSFVRLSCELEGHPLGGGMLKLEPREASNILLPALKITQGLKKQEIEAALSTLREWRHYAVSK